MVVQLAPRGQQMHLLSAKIHLTGKRAGYIPRSFKGGPHPFINLLSDVYWTEHIIHTGTSSRLLIRGGLEFPRTRPVKLFFCGLR